MYFSRFLPNYGEIWFKQPIKVYEKAGLIFPVIGDFLLLGFGLNELFSTQLFT